MVLILRLSLDAQLAETTHFQLIDEERGAKCKFIISVASETDRQEYVAPRTDPDLRNTFKRIMPQCGSLILGMDGRWVQLLGPSGGQMLAQRKKEYVELLLQQLPDICSGCVGREPEPELELEPEIEARRAPPPPPLPQREPAASDGGAAAVGGR
jgi:hypothetical protein